MNSNSFKDDLIREIETFVRVKEEEHQLVNCLLASSLQKNEDLKIKSLDLLLSLFSKNEGLEKFIKRLILIENGEESKIFNSILENANKLEVSKEKFESNIAGQGSDLTDFKMILRDLTISIKVKFEKKNSYKDITDFLAKDQQNHTLKRILKVRLVKKLAKPTLLFQYLNHSLHIVELLIDILNIN